MSVKGYIRKQFTSSLPAKTVIKGTKNIYLPGFHGFSLFEVFPQFIRQLKKNKPCRKSEWYFLQCIHGHSANTHLYIHADTTPAHPTGFYGTAIRFDQGHHSR